MKLFQIMSKEEKFNHMICFWKTHTTILTLKFMQNFYAEVTQTYKNTFKKLMQKKSVTFCDFKKKNSNRQIFTLLSGDIEIILRS